MEGQFFLTTIAGLGVSIAGFAGLVGAIGKRGDWSPVDRWRVRNIIGLGFLTALLALLPVAIYDFNGDLALTIRISSALLVASALGQIWSIVVKRDPEEWPSGAAVHLLGFFFLGALPNIVNLLLGHPGLLKLALLANLVHPANIFLNVVYDAARSRSKA